MKESDKVTSIVSLIIGRGGSTYKNKNVLPVLGCPLVQWTCAAAVQSKYISYFFCSSDDIKILDACAALGYIPIVRPQALSTADAQSCDAVRHALPIIEASIGKEVDVVVVQHANVGTITAQAIDTCIEILNDNSEASSVIPAHFNNEYHPARAKLMNSDGYLVPALTGDYSANRQSLPKACFFDHSFWVLRRTSIVGVGGQGPWPCMGNSILPHITDGCFDVHNANDLKKTEEWIINNNIPHPKSLGKYNG